MEQTHFIRVNIDVCSTDALFLMQLNDRRQSITFNILQ